MKVVKEYINETFTDESDPVYDLGIGLRNKIIKWLDTHKIKNYIINDDLSIDVDDNVELSRNLGDIKLPDYIKFNTIHGWFDISNNKLITFKGCPKKILNGHGYSGCFICSNAKVKSLRYFPKYVESEVMMYDNKIKFTEAQIRKISDVKGRINL